MRCPALSLAWLLLPTVAACDGEDPPGPPPQQPVLARVTVQKEGDGRGQFTSVPAGVVCDASCDDASFTFSDVERVVVVVEPARDAQFREAVCTPSSDRAVEVRVGALDEEGLARLELSTVVDDTEGRVGIDWTCRATFVQVYTLQIILPGSGSGRVRGALSAVIDADEPKRVDCPGDCVGAYFAGEVETLTAEADPGSVFVGWRFCADGTAPITLTMTGDQNCDAVFDLAP